MKTTEPKHGDRVKVTLEGTLEIIATATGEVRRVRLADDTRDRYAFSSRPMPLLVTPRMMQYAVAVERSAPKWQPGDVVVVRYNSVPTSTPWDDTTPYTYVRGAKDWPGDRRASRTDAQIDQLFAEGKVTHVLRDGEPVQ